MPAWTAPKRKKNKKRATPAVRNAQCLLCGRYYVVLTTTHLRTHGYTCSQYERTFSPAAASRPCAPSQTVGMAGVTPPSRAGSLPAKVAAASTAQLAENLLGSPSFMQRLTDEVGELLFSTHLRDQLRFALVQTLGKRMELHAAAVANLEAVRAELNQPWRVSRGGKDGGPTPTPHLVMVAGEAHQEVTKTEEALLKAVKLAVDEQRSNKDLARTDARPAFTGEAERIPVPPSLPAHERETIRTLFGLLKGEIEDRAAGDRAVQIRDTVDVSPSSPRNEDDPHISPSAMVKEGGPALGAESRSDLERGELASADAEQECSPAQPAAPPTMLRPAGEEPFGTE